MADAYTAGRVLRSPYDATQWLHQKAVDVVGQGVDAAVPAVQGFARGIAGLPRMEAPVPASTKTAVAVANSENDQPAYPTAFRAGYDAAPKVSAPASSGSKERNESPYPTFAPNVVSPGVRAATVSYPQINFNAPPPAVADGAAGVSNVGVLPPELHAQLAGFMDEARPLLSSAGIVDRLRGRQLLRARDRLLQGALGIAGARTAGINAESGVMGARASTLSAQTGAFRATNEVPLALLGASTQRYATDMSAERAAAHDATLRDINDDTNAVTRRGQELSLLPKMQDVYQGEEYGKRIAAGDEEGAAAVALHGRASPAPRNPPFQISPMGTGVYTMKDGLPTFVPNEQLDPMLNKRRDALGKLAPGK